MAVAWPLVIIVLINEAFAEPLLRLPTHQIPPKLAANVHAVIL